MEISWLGHSCFQLRGKNAIVITDPFTPQADATAVPTRLSKLNASIVTVSHNHAGHNYVTGFKNTPRIVSRPGEYEISDVLITGVAAYHDNKHGQEYGRNTIYVIHIDDLAVCHLGDLGHTLQEDQLEAVADADILLLPIGGRHSIQASQAAEIIGQVEPRIVIPMHYNSPPTGEGPDPLEKFYKEMGIETMTPQPKLNISRNSLPAEMQIILLSIQA